jgi:hydrogenase maturation factor HypE
MDQVLSRQQQEGLFSRVMELIYLSGRLLRKSNIRDFILMGNNLSYISGWRDTDTTNITKLID